MNGFSKITASLKKYIWVLYFAKQDPRVGWKARLVIIITLAYALSPIDLIPDFIPVLGQVDDLILIPLGIYIAIKLIPKHVWEECTISAKESMERGALLPKNWIVATIIALSWLLILIILGKWFWHAYL